MAADGLFLRIGTPASMPVGLLRGVGVRLPVLKP
jgi:hypothetical protein